MVEEVKGEDRNSEITEMIKLRRASFAASTDAQAFVIGIVLILSIVVTATTVYLAIYAPVETKKCEFKHATEVTEDFTALSSSTNSLSHAQASVASISVPIKMTPTKDSIIALPLSSGSLSFSPTKENITVKLNEPSTGTPGTWTDESFSNATTYNINTSSGNATLVGPPYSSGYLESNMSAVEGHSGKDTRSNSTIYENISWHTILPPNTEIIMKVRTDMFPNMTHAKEWHECPEIVSQDGVNKITLSDLSSISNGHRYVQFQAELKTWDPSETPMLINVTVNFSSSLEGVILANSSGSITFASNYHYLPNHELRYENGAVIKSQEGGGTMECPFNFSFNNVSGVPRINISLVNLTGTDVTHSGAPVTSVRLFRGDYKLISDSFFYPNLTLNISTDYPSICRAWFDAELKKSNLTTSYYNVTNVTDRSLEIEFYGHGKGVQLYLEKTTVLVEIET